MPIYAFRIDKMRPDPNAPPRLMNDIWLPPRVLGWNELESGDSSGKWYIFNPQVGRAQYLPQGLMQGYVHFRDVSVYYDNDNFWCVPYDATQYPVGDWRQDVQQEEDDDGTTDDDNHSPHWQDWHALRFEHEATTYTSFVGIGATQRTLITQRPDQDWVPKILPEVYHAPRNYRTPDTRFGALNGDLGLLLALVALSVRPRHVQRAVEHCIRGDGWRAAQSETRAGWTHSPRGVVVRIWIPAGTDQEMRQYERGEYGNIYN